MSEEELIRMMREHEELMLREMEEGRHRLYAPEAPTEEEVRELAAQLGYPADVVEGLDQTVAGAAIEYALTDTEGRIVWDVCARDGDAYRALQAPLHGREGPCGRCHRGCF